MDRLNDTDTKALRRACDHLEAYADSLIYQARNAIHELEELRSTFTNDDKYMKLLAKSYGASSYADEMRKKVQELEEDNKRLEALAYAASMTCFHCRTLIDDVKSARAYGMDTFCGEDCVEQTKKNEGRL